MQSDKVSKVVRFEEEHGGTLQIGECGDIIGDHKMVMTMVVMMMTEMYRTMPMLMLK